ncbi:hypothetical protein Pmar_PMAR023313 [Perkinsus marinus ATCC 50983]|uniref:Cilia- and flagella-associated protein 251 n=1 Tax=Perkinsus marinus (strain ATCC 50983 / TXsc) TaxID=423536 RepID=C5KK78_PERM5|nr:hypothetical protein Pmar_PMAR023313 [Perkinsus marinus ATCC 50983]EER14990.1 hypothetical protein Pmar_PMAR023313 [Perkinsus marinus ATCC 50983]|eukprot:XP_002783194.1 hypothetical protein Pmar_PMAR023313 [Perkinsus marinus ATCC 50983]
MVPPAKTSNANALTLEWNLGLNKDLTDCVFNLSTAGEKGGTEVFYPTGNCGVIYDSTTGQQRLLQGHVNTISATVMGRDRQFIVTADAGRKSLLVVWDRYLRPPKGRARSSLVLKAHNCTDTYHRRPASAPAETDDDGKDSQDPVEASRRLSQTMAIWDWTDTDRQEPLCSHRIPSNDLQTMVLFNRWNVTEIASNGMRRAIFWRWDIEAATKPSITEVPPAIFNCYCPVVNAKDLNQRVGDFTMTAFLPSTSQVATGTVDGDVVIWDHSLIAGSDPTSARHRRAVKVIRLAAQGVSLTVLKVHDDFIVVGSSDGAVRFYDFNFKIKAWFEDISAGVVKSISFRAPKPVPVEQSVTRRAVSPSKNLVGTRPGDSSNDGPFHCEPFLVSTTSALIVNVDCEVIREPQTDFSTEGRDVVDALLALIRKEETGIDKIPLDVLLQRLLRTNAQGAEIEASPYPDERLTYEEFEQCLKSLVHDENATIESVLEDVVDPVVFVRDLLGFDDVSANASEMDGVMNTTEGPMGCG